MTEKDDNPKINYTRAFDVTNEKLDSLILQVDIDEKFFSYLWFIDNKWEIVVSTDDGHVSLEWYDFLEIINKLHQHVVNESEKLVHELKNPESDEGSESQIEGD